VRPACSLAGGCPVLGDPRLVVREYTVTIPFLAVGSDKLYQSVIGSRNGVWQTFRAPTNRSVIVPLALPRCWSYALTRVPRSPSSAVPWSANARTCDQIASDDDERSGAASTRRTRVGRERRPPITSACGSYPRERNNHRAA
jgi:hypothetical protein